MPSPSELLQEANKYKETLVGIRRDLHQIPEFGLNLPKSQERILQSIHGLGEIHLGKGLNSIGLVIKGGKPGPTVLLRADMAPLDLLPEPGAIKQAIELARRPVSEVMLSPVPTVSADAALRRVAAVLLDTGLPGLPVTDEAGVLAGFISRTDILRAVAADPPLDLWSGPAVAL